MNRKSSTIASMVHASPTLMKYTRGKSRLLNHHHVIAIVTGVHIAIRIQPMLLANGEKNSASREEIAQQPESRAKPDHVPDPLFHGGRLSDSPCYVFPDRRVRAGGSYTTCPSIDIVISFTGIVFPDLASAWLMTYSTPVQQGTSMWTAVIELMV